MNIKHIVATVGADFVTWGVLPVALVIGLVLTGSAFADGAASNLALETPTTVRDCNDLSCFGRLAIREQFAQHTMKEVTMTSDMDCTLVDGVTDGECRVVADPSPDGRAKQKYSECTSLTCFGAIYVRKLFFSARSINAVMLGTDQECGWLNDEFKEKIPCGSLVRVLATR